MNSIKVNKKASIIQVIILLYHIALIIGLFWSRALLSIASASSVLFLFLIPINSTVSFLKSKIFIWSFLPIILFCFGIYQNFFIKENFDYLVPVLVYPCFSIFIFCSLYFCSFQKILFVWLIGATASLFIIWANFFLNYKTIYTVYSSAQTLLLLMDTDHVRYSIFIAAILLLVILFKQYIKYYYTFLVLFTLSLIVFSVRTGWAALFIILVLSFNKLFLYKFDNKKKIILLFIGTFILIGVYILVPSIKAKINYTKYDYELSNSDTNYNSNLSDGIRKKVNSTTTSLIFNQKKVNIGWAALSPTLKNELQKKYKVTNENNYGWPFNQFLLWLISVGWVGTLLFCCWLLYPMLIGLKNNLLYGLFIFTCIIIASCLVESTLNLQYGIFLHGFFINLIWQFKSSSLK